MAARMNGYEGFQETENFFLLAARHFRNRLKELTSAASGSRGAFWFWLAKDLLDRNTQSLCLRNEGIGTRQITPCFPIGNIGVSFSDERGEFALKKAGGLTGGFQPSYVIWIGKIGHEQRNIPILIL